MTRIPPLPQIMVAPNGARRTRADHPALPMTITETVATAKSCQIAGADGLHAHIRDAEGNHILDGGLYQELLVELSRETPNLYVQITTEAVGRYSPQEQRAMVRMVKPAATSISIREMLEDGENHDISIFYNELAEQGTAVQHILYSTGDMNLLQSLLSRQIIPASPLQLLFVLGRYSRGQISSPDDLLPFVDTLKSWQTDHGITADWACCAFGQSETDCLLKARQLGGKIRIGFENNLHHADGTLARDNADRIMTFIAATKSANEREKRI